MDEIKRLREVTKALDVLQENEMPGYTIKFSKYASGFVAYAMDEHEMPIATSASFSTTSEAKADLVAFMEDTTA